MFPCVCWAEPKESPAETSVIVLTVSSKRFHVLSDKDISSVTRAALISLLTVKHKTCSCSPVSRWGTQRRFGLCAVVDAAGGAAGLKTACVCNYTLCLFSVVFSILLSCYFSPVFSGFFVSSFQTWISWVSFSFSCRSLTVSLAEFP